MKRCYKCEIEKPLDQFTKNPTKSDGLNSLCRQCNSEYQREWYKKNKAKHNEATKERNTRLRKKLRQRMYNYLSNHPCVDCGISNPIVLEFDHVRGNKSFGISHAMTNLMSWEKILKEIEKCEVRCSNCHKIKTAKDFNWYDGIHEQEIT